MAGSLFAWADVAHTIEIPGVYDGWSIAVLKDGTMINRWADTEDPTKPAEGYERRYRMTEEAIRGDLSGGE